MLPVTLVVQGILVHVKALILPLGVLFQFANSSSEPRQTCFITRYLKEFFGMRVVERPCPISHDPCFRATLLDWSQPGAADPALTGCREQFERAATKLGHGAAAAIRSAEV